MDSTFPIGVHLKKKKKKIICISLEKLLGLQCLRNIRLNKIKIMDIEKQYSKITLHLKKQPELLENKLF